jgi:hypothetical protein
MKNKTVIQTRLIAAAAMAVVLASSQAVFAQSGNPPVLPPGSQPYGASYSQWSAAWWNWAASIPAASNPILDSTGENAAQGQAGPVWFLAGNFGGTSTRNVTVPAGKALFIPLLNTAYLGFPCDERNLPGCEIDEAFEAANDIDSLLSFIAPSMDGAALGCEIDGVAVQNLTGYRVESSTIYSVSLPDQNIFGLPPGSYHPVADTGYYVMIAPLPRGNHIIHFTGANADNSFSIDVTYHVKVQEGVGSLR